MAGFYGRRTVLRDLAKHRRTGKVTSATLHRNSGGGDLAWANVYVWPTHETTGVGGGGNVNMETTVTAWRVGETDMPRADDRLEVGADVWNVAKVTRRLNADEASNFAVYDCTVYRAA